MAANIEEVIIPAKVEFNAFDDKSLQDIQKRLQELSDTYTKQISEIQKADTSRGQNATKNIREQIDVNRVEIEKSIQNIGKLMGSIDANGKNLDFDPEEKLNELLKERASLLQEINKLQAESRKNNSQLGANQNSINAGNRKLEKGNLSDTDTRKIQDNVMRREQENAKLRERNQLIKDSISTMQSELAQKDAIIDKTRQAVGNEAAIAEMNKRSRDAIADARIQIEDEVKAVNEVNRETRDLINNSEKVTVSETKAANAMKESARASKSQVKSENDRANATKKSSAQVYYLLRSFKMLGETIRKADAAMGRLTSGIINFAKTGVKAITRMTAGMASFPRHLKDAKKHNDGLNMSLKNGIKLVLAYGLGLRSVFAIFRRLRKYVLTGLQKMSIQFAYVNRQMSSTVASLNQMKAATATVVQPLLNVLAPALMRLSALFTQLTVAIGSFFAALTGQSFVYKAVRVQSDYAASLQDSAGAAGKLNDELDEMLGHYDELNVITKDDPSKGSGGGGGGGGDFAPGYQYEEIPIADQYQKAAEKVKKIFEKLFDPLKQAWDAKGKKVLDAWKSALSSVISLLETIGKDFLTVWDQPASIQIWEDLLDVLANIGSIVSSLADNFKSAWEEGGKGEKILEAIRDIIAIVADGLKRCSDAAAEWAKNLDFNPLLQATLDFLQKIQPLIQTLVDLGVAFYEKVVLPFRKFIIEEGLPQLLTVLGDIATKINDALPVDKLNEFMEAFEPFLEKTWKAFCIILEDIGNAIADITGSEGFSNFIDLLIKWMNDASPEEMAKGIEDLAIAIAKIWAFFKISGFVVTALTNILTVVNTIKNLGIGVGLSNFAELLAVKIGPLVTTVVGNLSALLPRIAGFFTGPAGIITLIALALPAIVKLATKLDEFADWFKNLGKNFSKWVDDIGPKVKKAFKNAGKTIGKAVGTFFKNLFNDFKELGNMDWQEIGENIIEGILHIFDGGIKLLSYIVQAVGEFFKGFWDGICEAFGIASPAKKMNPIGENILKGILKGITDAIKNIGSWVKTNIFDKFKKALDTAFGFVGGVAKKVVNTGKGILTGIKNGVTTGWTNVKSKVTATWDKVKSSAESHLKDSKFISIAKSALKGIKSGVSKGWANIKSNVKETWQLIKDSAADGKLSKDEFKTIGSNILNGLKNGIVAGWNFVKSGVTSIWNKLVDSAKNTFKQHSPSKVFEEIGVYNVEGLANGMESEAKKLDTDDMFEDMVDTDDMVDDYGLDETYNKVVSMFEKMKDTITNIMKDMSMSVREEFKSMMSVNNMSKISSMELTGKVPSIAKGSKLPSNGNFYISLDNSELYNKLPNIISDAVDDAFTSAINSTFNSSRNNQPIMLQLNGRTIAQAVWAENEKRYKQTGRRY